MSGRVSPIAPAGSLLKAMREAKRPRRGKRDTDRGYLALIRRCPCVSCDADPGGEAAHVRTGTGGGMGLKPDDRWCVPLCHVCHMEQHETSEVSFWLKLGLDPVRIAISLQTISPPSLDALRGVILMYKERRK